MGWFLLSKKNYNKKKVQQKSARKQSSSANKAEWNPNRTLVRFKILGACLLILFIAGAWNFGYSSLSKQIKQSYTSAISPLRVSLINPPSWMSAGITNNIKQTVASQISSNPLNGKSLHQAVLTLSKVPWVKKVVQIERTTNGQINVYALYRTPLAMVKYGNGYRLISSKSIALLAKPYNKKQAQKIGLPVITGVSSVPPATAGNKWKDKDLYAGIALIHLLENQKFFSQISAINVGRHDARGRQRLLIYTANGGKIAWGYAPNIRQEIEPNSAIKIARLNRLAQVYNGSIDGGAKYIEIYGAAIQTQAAPLKRWNAVNNTGHSKS